MNLKINRRTALMASGLVIFTMLVTATGCQQANGAENSEELPAFAYNSEETLSAYKISQTMPEILAEVACYCGCGETQNHESLKDCFINQDGSFSDHASNCHVCAIEAIDANDWFVEGLSPEQISVEIDAKYSDYGDPTQKVPVQGFQTGKEYEGGARILFLEESVDMGQMTTQASRDYSFIFKNTGDEYLEIEEVVVRAIEGC